MIIAIAGVPGTGKTTVAEALSRRTGAKVISTSEIVEDRLVKYEIDEGRGVKIVDPNDLQKAITHVLPYKAIIEGMLSHLLASDMVVILRCNPQKLTQRLKEKGWDEKKIKENVDSEIIDVITTEALEKHSKDKIIEIDTSSLSPEKTAAAIEEVMKGHREKYSIGKIDWTVKYASYLVG